MKQGLITRHPETRSSRRRKTHQLPSAKKFKGTPLVKHKAMIIIMATVFRDLKTAHVVDSIYCFATVTAQNYYGTLEKTRQTIWCIWSGLLRQGVINVNANAKPLSANRTWNWLRRATAGTLLTTLATGQTLRLVISISLDVLWRKAWQANLQKTPTRSKLSRDYRHLTSITSSLEN